MPEQNNSLFNSNFGQNAVRKAWEVAVLPAQIVYDIGQQAILGAREVAQSLDPSAPPLHERIRQEKPLHDADVVGRSAIEHGRRRGDEQLKAMGEAMVAKAVVQAADSEHVPDHITEKVVEVAKEQGIDPHANPYVPHDIAWRVDQTMNEFTQE